MDDETAQYLLRNPELRFCKGEEAAGFFLLAISNALLEGREIPMQSQIALGQALREAALLSLNTHTKADKKAAGKSLLKSLALEKRGGMDHFERSAMTGQTKQKLADLYNIGKNEVPELLDALTKSERELLKDRIPITVGHLIRVIQELGPGAESTEAAKRLRDGLKPQFRMLTAQDIENHVNEAMREAHNQGLIEKIGRASCRERV